MHKLPFTTLRHSKSFLKYFAKEIAEKIDDFNIQIGLQANNFNNTVEIQFKDSSAITLKDAFFVLKKKEPPKEFTEEEIGDENFDEYAVFTEHHGYFFFYAEEVKKIKEKEIKRISYNDLLD